jgi:hypothetical protein
MSPADVSKATLCNAMRALHQRFAKHRKNGEWFEPWAELLDLIGRLTAPSNE